MKKSIIIALVILLVLASTAQASSRSMSLITDGYIEYHTIAESGSTKTATKIDGEGKLIMGAIGSYNATGLDQRYTAELTTAPEALFKLRAVTGLMAGNDNGTHYEYALLIEPDRGEAARFDIAYNTSIKEYAAIGIEAEAEVTRGLFAAHLYVINPALAIELHERIMVRGSAAFRDSLLLTGVPKDPGATE